MPLDSKGKYRMNPAFYRPKPDNRWEANIGALKHLLQTTGPLWTGTRLSGYAESGPYHCGECKYLSGENCKHPAVNADPQVKKDKDGMPVVDPKRGCCEFVDPS